MTTDSSTESRPRVDALFFMQFIVKFAKEYPPLLLNEDAYDELESIATKLDIVLPDEIVRTERIPE